MINSFRAKAYSLALKVDGLFSTPVQEALRIVEDGEHLSLEELTELRNSAFVRLIEHAYHSVPYYNTLLNNERLKPNDFRTIDDIEKLPILTKDDIRNAGKSLQSIKIKDMDYIICRSGGTTGEPIASYVDRRARALGTYAAQRGYIWMGWKPGIPIVTLFGGSLGRPTKTTLRVKLRDFALGTVFLPAFELNRENASKYLKVIDENIPCIIKGYASALYNLALYAEALNYKTNSIIGVFSTAEYLPDQWSEKISRVFNCPVKCYYGCGEINSLGFQTKQYGPYIIPDEHVIIESKLKKDTIGIDCDNSLLVTSLFNYAQPLIRYQLGDVGDVSLPGSLHPTHSTITNLIGRTSDMFARKDGTKIPPSLAYHMILKTKLPVIKYQFIQKDFNSIEFLYDPSNTDLTDSEKEDITSIIKTQISKEINLKFIKTKKFVLPTNGKQRIVISEIGEKYPKN